MYLIKLTVVIQVLMECCLSIYASFFPSVTLFLASDWLISCLLCRHSDIKHGISYIVVHLIYFWSQYETCRKTPSPAVKVRNPRYSTHIFFNVCFCTDLLGSGKKFYVTKNKTLFVFCLFVFV